MEKEENAFADTCLLRRDISVDEPTMQEVETADAKWVTLQCLDKIIDNGMPALPIAAQLKPLRKAFEAHRLKNKYR